MRRAGIALLAFTVSVRPVLQGCRTAPIRERSPIRVPAGLDADEVELAIVIGIVDPPPDSIELKHQASQITQEILTVIFGQPEPRRGWFVESREPGVVYAGYQRRQHYLSTAISYNTEEMRIRIVRSENLRQSTRRIHKSVYAWIAELEGRIRRALGSSAIRSLQSRTPQP